MNHLKTILFFLLLIGTTTPTKAQFWKKIKKKIEKKTEDKINAKIDKTTDKLIDKALDGKKKEKKSSTDPVTTPKQTTTSTTTYKFNQSVTVQVNSGSADTVSFEFLFSKNNKDITCMKINESSMKDTQGMKGEVYIVSSKDKSTMFMNMMGMKIKKATDGNQMEQYNNAEQLDKTSITATGKTKTILGYSCTEYIAKNEDITVQFWATNQDFPIKGVFVPILGMRNNNAKIKGFVLEMNVTSAQNKQSIKVTSINKNANVTIHTNEYKSMGF